MRSGWHEGQPEGSARMDVEKERGGGIKTSFIDYGELPWAKQFLKRVLRGVALATAIRTAT